MPESFESVPDLIAAVDEYLPMSNTDPTPFVWHASIESILAKIARCNALYETVHYGLASSD